MSNKCFSFHSRGCDKDALNFANQTAYQVAVIAGNLDLAEIINSHRPEDIGEFFFLGTFCSGVLHVFCAFLNQDFFEGFKANFGCTYSIFH